MIELTRDPIDVGPLTETVRSPASGAIVVFLGTVREMTGDLRTVALDYEAYPEMALVQMQKLAERAKAQWPVDRLAIIHRLGRLGLGEVSVGVAVSCPHRKDAFLAGQFLIDELKVTVPIWKKENWADGRTEWVHPGGDPSAKAPAFG
jgi:molybdopterin synthase catalytic subunit